MDDCEEYSGLRDRFRDGSARLDGPQTAPSSTKSGGTRVVGQTTATTLALTGGYLLMEVLRVFRVLWTTIWTPDLEFGRSRQRAA